MRVLLVTSPGGHLAQLAALRSWWEQHTRVWVTFNTGAVADLAGEDVRWAHHPTTRNLPNAWRNFWLAVRLLRAERPDVVVSTGAGVAVPFFVAARFLRIRTAYVEVIDRIDSRTLTGTLVYPISDVFAVQWAEQLALYPRATLIGSTL